MCVKAIILKFPNCCVCMQALHSVGLRKFFLAGIGPLGCIPNQRATAPPGRCVDAVNQMLGTFNEGLRSMVDQLNANHPNAIFAYGNTYGVFGDILNNPAAYGNIYIYIYHPCGRGFFCLASKSSRVLNSI